MTAKVVAKPCHLSTVATPAALGCQHTWNIAAATTTNSPPSESDLFTHFGIQWFVVVSSTNQQLTCSVQFLKTQILGFAYLRLFPESRCRVPKQPLSTSTSKRFAAQRLLSPPGSSWFPWIIKLAGATLWFPTWLKSDSKLVGVLS